MLNAIPMVISKESFEQIFTFAEDNSALAKNLYNAALFRIRQVFTGWNKTKRTDLEQLVFDELKQTEAVYKSFKPRHVLSYAALDKIMRATGNPDFFAGLPMQTAQQVLKDAVHDFKAWLDSLKKYKKDPSNYTGKPKMPGYCKSSRKTFTVTNQDAVIYPVVDKNGCITGNELNTLPANRICIMCTGSQGEPMAALSRIANGTHRFIKILPGDTVLFSSNPIPGNAVSVGGVINQLTRVGANVITNSPLTSFHTTGHAPQEEQKLMLNLIKPKYFMPNHGEYKMLVQHSQTAMTTGIPKENCFVCANGDVLVLRNEEVFEAKERIQTDAIYVDGNDASGLSTSVIKDRRILAENGLVAVIVTIDSRYNKILCRPNIVSRGFVYIKESQTLLKEAELIVYDALKKKMQQRTTFGELKNCIRSSLEPYLYKKTNRNPIVIPIILNQKAAMEEIQAKMKARQASTRRK